MSKIITNREILNLEPSIYVRAQDFYDSFFLDSQGKYHYVIYRPEWVNQIVTQLLRAKGPTYVGGTSYWFIFKSLGFIVSLCQNTSNIRKTYLEKVDSFELYLSPKLAGEWIAEFPDACNYLCLASKEILDSENENKIPRRELYSIAYKQYFKDLAPVFFDALSQIEIPKETKRTGQI